MPGTAATVAAGKKYQQRNAQTWQKQAQSDRKNHLACDVVLVKIQQTLDLLLWV
jgi:hypothetical protein